MRPVEFENGAVVERTADLSTLLPQVAAELGDGWFVTPGHHGADTDGYLNGPEGELIWAKSGGHSHRTAERDRIFFTSSVPDALREHSRYAGRTSITVRFDRPPATIAGELQRRLVEANRTEIAEARRRSEEHLHDVAGPDPGCRPSGPAAGTGGQVP